MLVKKIAYKDFDGNDRNETFYFNLTKAEALELEMEEKGGLISLILTMIEEQNTPKLFKLFKKLIGLSIGKKSNDGRNLVKGEDIANDFFTTNAYDVLMLEIMKSPESAADFVNGIIPQDVADEAKNYEVKDGEIVNKATGENVTSITPNA